MSKTLPFAFIAAVALGSFTVLTAFAQPGASHGAAAVRGPNGAAAGQRGIVADGNGNVAARSGGAFATENGAHGTRQREFKRSSDGSVSGSSQTNVTGANGNSVQGTTTYEKGEGLSRSATCKDASGNTIQCGSR